jgi:SAM-dependent methyltransferase
VGPSRLPRSRRRTGRADAGRRGLRPEQDAYGRIVYDHLRGVRTSEVIERDDGFFAASTGATAYFAPYPRWPRPEREAMRFVRGRVLDVGAGAGRCALHLQGRGHEVVAIDVSPLAVRTCRLRGVRDARVVPITAVSHRLGAPAAAAQLVTANDAASRIRRDGRERRPTWMGLHDRPTIEPASTTSRPPFTTAAEARGRSSRSSSRSPGRPPARLASHPHLPFPRAAARTSAPLSPYRHANTGCS